MDNIKNIIYIILGVFFGILIYINKYIRQSYSFEEYSSINTGKYTEKGYPIDDDASKDIEKIIIIYAAGRSGSTTLQRIINSIKNSNITGEKWGAINDLLNCYLNIKRTNEMTPKKEGSKMFLTSDELEKAKIKPAWYNSYNFNIVKRNIKNTIVSILTDNKPEKILGFKELIRISDCVKFEPKLIKAFKELFPNTKFILHIDDNLDRQSRSAWWQGNVKKSKEYLRKTNIDLINYSKKDKDCYLSYMKNLFKIDEVKKLFEFLDETFDEEEYNHIIKNNYAD